MTKFDKYFLSKLKKDKKTSTWMPTKVVYSDEGMKSWQGGYCKYLPCSNYIQIREKYKNDKGILAHELTHARQHGLFLFFHPLLTFFDKYILFIELDAYREQVKAYNYTKEGQYMWIVNALVDPNRYGLNISMEEAMEYADFMFGDLINKD